MYVICPGKVFRTDELDATHTPVFHQVEGLAVDEGLTMAHLKGTLDHVRRTSCSATGIGDPAAPVVLPVHRAQRRAGPAVLRLPRRGDPACRTCGGTGWIEWGGCGMVNPQRAAACGVDPDRYSGFAFGMGIERTPDAAARRRGHARHRRGRRPVQPALRDGDLMRAPDVLAARATPTWPGGATGRDVAAAWSGSASRRRGSTAATSPARWSSAGC